MIQEQETILDIDHEASHFCVLLLGWTKTFLVQTRIHTDNSSARNVFDPALGAHWKQDKDRP